MVKQDAQLWKLIPFPALIYISVPFHFFCNFATPHPLRLSMHFPWNIFLGRLSRAQYASPPMVVLIPFVYGPLTKNIRPTSSFRTGPFSRPSWVVSKRRQIVDDTPILEYGLKDCAAKSTLLVYDVLVR